MSYLAEQPPNCDLLRLSLVTGRFVRKRRAKLLFESELVKKDMEKGREISFLEDVGG